MTVIGVKASGENKSPEEATEFRGVLYDSLNCAGCQECEFACAKKNNLPAPEDYPEAGKVRKTSVSQRKRNIDG